MAQAKKHILKKRKKIMMDEGLLFERKKIDRKNTLDRRIKSDLSSSLRQSDAIEKKFINKRA